MIIGISGKIGSGKDTIGLIIQWLTGINSHIPFKEWVNSEYNYKSNSNFEIHKFADTLKDIVCLLIGCTREQLEDREFKEKELGEEWWFNKIVPENGFGSKLINWDKDLKPEKMTPRLLLQLLGTECLRNIIHPNAHVNALMNKYIKDEKQWLNKAEWDLEKTGKCNPSEDAYPNWIITDVRFPNELKAVKDRSGISIRVNRQETYGNLTKEGLRSTINQVFGTEHPSETALDNAEFDYIINNNGSIEDLINKIREILEKENII